MGTHQHGETAPWRVIASSESWIESKATDQLGHAATLPGMVRVVGLPDLHPGKGIPIGAAFLTRGSLYPHLIGNDIGCGYGFWQLSLASRKLKLDRAESRLTGLEVEAASWREGGWVEQNLSTDTDQDKLGTVGGGNHFVELQVIEEVVDQARFERHGLSSDRLMLLVHSGSRGVGERALRRHVDRHGASPIQPSSDAGTAYLADHQHAVRWAKANRLCLALAAAARLHTDIEDVFDLPHNLVERVACDHSDERRDDSFCWLHRKGAQPANRPLIVIPGSRGTHSWLVEPLEHAKTALWSLAHGAGRKWARHDVKGRLKAKSADLERTALGSRVICKDRALLFEEAPEAYKTIERVLKDLIDAKLCRPLASLRPLVTYKTGGR